MLSTIQADVELDVTVSPQTAEANQAVICSDGPDYTEKEKNDNFPEFILHWNLAASKVSPHFGGLSKDGCNHWKSKAAERFTGPWNETLANPILIIGNTVC